MGNAEHKRNEIAAVVSQHIEQSIKNYSLLGGNFGEIFFLYYYSLVDKSYEEKADNALDTLFHLISSQKQRLIHTYCNGLAGVGVGLHLLEEEGFLSGISDSLDDFDLYLETSLKREFQMENTDFLHGIIGIGFYFIKRHAFIPEKAETQLTLIMDYLAQIAMVDEANEQLKWQFESEDTETKEKKMRTNISLSHGMSSVILFLSRLVAKDILPERLPAIRQQLVWAANYIIAQQLDCEKQGSFFPVFSNEEFTGRSRLAWCYGDLGVAVALYQVGRVLQRKDYEEFAIKVLRHAALHRRDLTENAVFDAGICHGAAGVGQIFYRMFKQTGLKEFYEAYAYWKEIVVRMGYHKNGLAGYKHFNAAQMKWDDSTAVLEGIAGIGLFLLSEVNPDWDEVLLLNFRG